MFTYVSCLGHFAFRSVWFLFHACFMSASFLFHFYVCSVLFLLLVCGTSWLSSVFLQLLYFYSNLTFHFLWFNTVIWLHYIITGVAFWCSGSYLKTFRSIKSPLKTGWKNENSNSDNQLFLTISWIDSVILLYHGWYQWLLPCQRPLERHTTT